jgi:ATP-dependent RNA helicase SUPV3L1/SUV3
VKAGALDIFLPAMLKAGAQSAWAALHGRPPVESMPVLIPAPRKGALPFYRLLGPQALRIDRAESCCAKPMAAVSPRATGPSCSIPRPPCAWG